MYVNTLKVKLYPEIRFHWRVFFCFAHRRELVRNLTDFDSPAEEFRSLFLKIEFETKLFESTVENPKDSWKTRQVSPIAPRLMYMPRGQFFKRLFCAYVHEK
jgi:hypothetical protein